MQKHHLGFPVAIKYCAPVEMADASLADMEKQLADHAAAVKALKAKIAERKAKAAAAPPPPPAPPSAPREAPPKKPFT